MTLAAIDADAIAETVTLEGAAPLAAAGCAAWTRSGSKNGAWKKETGGATRVLFDLASLTKPMTAAAVARAHVERTAMLGELVPNLADTKSATVTLEHLLAHRTGLEAHVPLYAPLTRGERVEPLRAVHDAADARRADAQGRPPAEGFAPLYSDLGYVLAGIALAHGTGATDAGSAITHLVVEPLGLSHELGTARGLEARGVPIAREAAPTEDVPWRGGVVRGRVHDENAWALTGTGGSGHAGIFGTVGAVLAFGCAFLDSLQGRPSLLDGGSGFGWLVAQRPGGTLRAGFDGKSPEGSSAGSLAGPATFGHLGFTGTSLWIDPDARAVVVLLTNRVHPSRETTVLRALRPRAHDALFARARSLVSA